jgi:hypothetical protein
MLYPLPNTKILDVRQMIRSSEYVPVSRGMKVSFIKAAATPNSAEVA